MDLSPDQINQLQSLGIKVPASGSIPQANPEPIIEAKPEPIPVINPPVNPPTEPVSEPEPLSESISQPPTNISEDIKQAIEIAPSSPQILSQTISSTQPTELLTKPKTPHSPIVPLLSITGLTAISFGGLLLFKSKEATIIQPNNSPDLSPRSSQSEVGPTQVPKSIQHYLLTSQQYFTQALQMQNVSVGTSAVDQNQMASLVNQSILSATEGIKEFPQDPRGWEQRGRIYQSLIGSQPQMITLAINDFVRSSELNPTSVDSARTLASLYAKMGDAQNTLSQLNKIVTIEPTKAQNFYDLARLQQQIGQLSPALDTYNRLLSLLTDPTQKQQVQTEVTTLQQLVAQSPSNSTLPSPSTSSSPLPASSFEGNLIQASATSELIIAAPETSKKIEVTNLTASNSLSGASTLPANNKQITITNQNLTSTSQVYVTVTKGGKNLSLQVLSRSAGTFVVGLDSPTTENIEFKWWIVNP